MPTVTRLLIAFLMTGSGALAEGPVDPTALAGPCANCHGPDGHSAGAIPSIPSIAGLPEAETAALLRAFRADEVPGATVMPRLMKGYDEAQIDMLAKWFAEVKS